MGGERTQRCCRRAGFTARAFLESTSIRGVGKILKSQSQFLCRLWALFVLGSTSLLFYSAFKVTIDYLQYDVNIQTRLDIDDATPFPAVSICNNQPFSERAYQQWSAKRIKSPTQFNKELRQHGLELMKDPSMPEVYGKVRRGQADQQTMAKFNQQIGDSVKALAATLFMDSSRLYYQNLSPDEAAQLGHERNKSIVDCIFKYNSQQVQGTKGCYDNMIKVTSFSHPNYFNCLTLEFDKESFTEVHSLTLILWLGPRENYDIRHRQGFLYDIFEQAYGLRVSIHEPYSHPRILEQGIQTEPGKMNEIKYQPVRFIRADTPKNPCVSAEDERQTFRKFIDHGKRYAYDQELCLNSRVQEAFLSSCGCLYVELPTVTPPNATHPYCGHLDEKIYNRAKCASTLDQRQIRQTLEVSECLPRCQQLSYEKELSVTKWRDTQWMLHWIKEVSERWASHMNSLEDQKSTEAEFKSNLEQLREYFRMENITDPRLLGGSGAGTFQFNDSFTYVVVKRQSNNTLVRQEKIVLTVNALFSRIGGLCSMYIGLTLAFFVECIELLYRLVFDRRSESRATASQPLDAAADSGGPDDQRVLYVTYVAAATRQDEAVEKLDLLDARGRPSVSAAVAAGTSNGGDDFLWIRQGKSRSGL